MVASYDVLRLAKVCSRKPQNKMLQSHLLTLLIAINDELVVLSDLSYYVFVKFTIAVS